MREDRSVWGGGGARVVVVRGVGPSVGVYRLRESTPLKAGLLAVEIWCAAEAWLPGEICLPGEIWLPAETLIVGEALRVAETLFAGGL